MGTSQNVLVPTPAVKDNSEQDEDRPNKRAVRRGFRPGERWLLAVLYASPLLAFAVSAAPVVPLLGLGLSAMILQRLDREQKVK